MVKQTNKTTNYRLLLPVLALFLVGFIGVLMTFKSNASVPPEGWTTIKGQTGSWTMLSGTALGFSPVLTADGTSRYRFCVVVKASSGTTNRLLLRAKQAETNKVLTQSVSGYIGTSDKTVCSSSGVYPYGLTRSSLTKYSGSAGEFYFTKFYWQKYY